MKLPLNNYDYKNNSSHIPFRLNLIFFSIFILFALLILRLGYMQIIRGEDYQAVIDRTESQTITQSVARGEIYDSNHTPLVKNNSMNTITYTRGPNTDANSMANIAYDLATIIDVPNSTEFDNVEDPVLTERDLKDYFYAANEDEMQERIDSYLDNNPDVNPDDMTYEESLNLITTEDIANLSEHDQSAATIFTRMNTAYSLSTVNIKEENVSETEIAQVSANMDALPGVGTGMDWERTYPQGDMLRSVLGNVSTEEQGLPESHLNAYLAKGYSRNDRVGTSLLEAQYEPVLKGTKSRVETEVNNNGEIVSQVVQHRGNKGDNLVLSIDLEFQERVEQITRNAIPTRVDLADSAYAVVLDPKTGQILAMTGQQIDENGNYSDDALGNIQKAFTMGSSIKGATVISASMDGVLDETNEVIVDEPLVFSGTSSITSVFNRTGREPLDIREALQYSSNIYMSKLAMRMGGKWDYTPNEVLQLDYNSLMNKFRYYFGQFGLGTPTGIDLPNESTGQFGNPTTSTIPLFQSFGQFDTYTNLQVAQYMATIANNGTRLAPSLVSEIRETNPETGELGKLKANNKPEIMNHIDIDPYILNEVQQGFYDVLNGGYGYGYMAFSDTPYEAAGKTGTAESNYWGPVEDMRGAPVTNMTFAGYAPFDDPEIVVATVIPYQTDSKRTYNHLSMARNIMDAYFELNGSTEATNTEAEDGTDIEDNN